MAFFYSHFHRQCLSFVAHPHPPEQQSSSSLRCHVSNNTTNTSRQFCNYCTNVFTARANIIGLVWFGFKLIDQSILDCCIQEIKSFHMRYLPLCLLYNRRFSIPLRNSLFSIFIACIEVFSSQYPSIRSYSCQFLPGGSYPALKNFNSYDYDP